MYCSKEQLKDDLKHYLAGYKPGDECMPNDAPYKNPHADKIIASFESVDYDVDAYVMNRVYESLESYLSEEILTDICLIHVPPIEECLIDWYNGYLDFINWDCKGKWDIHQEERAHIEKELLRQLYWCDTYESFWMFINSHGNIESLYLWYKGINPEPGYEIESGIPCYCEPKPELVNRFENFFDIKPEQPKRRALDFSIEGEEFERWCEFHDKHQHKEATGKQGDQFKFHFYHSGFGVISSVSCLECGEEEILTDLDSL